MPLTRYDKMSSTTVVTQNRVPSPPALECNKCGSTWFSIKSFAQYQAEFVVSLGMQPALLPDSPVCHILECVCGELYEVKASRLANNEMNKKYDAFLDVVEKRNSTSEE
jgi:hypothetical protein